MEEFARRLPQVLVDADAATLTAADDENLDIASGGDDLAYIVYTSGSAGMPKGVMVSQRALTNHMLWMQRALPLTEADCTLLKYAFSFDVAAVEIFAPLLAGGRLIITPPDSQLDAPYLVKLIAEERISVLDVVPSLLTVLLEEPGFQLCRDLRQIVCGGETLPAELVEQVFARLPGVRLYNAYGPTEATITATLFTCSPGERPSQHPDRPADCEHPGVHPRSPRQSGSDRDSRRVVPGRPRHRARLRRSSRPDRGGVRRRSLCRRADWTTLQDGGSRALSARREHRVPRPRRRAGQGARLPDRTRRGRDDAGSEPARARRSRGCRSRRAW